MQYEVSPQIHKRNFVLCAILVGILVIPVTPVMRADAACSIPCSDALAADAVTAAAVTVAVCAMR